MKQVLDYAFDLCSLNFLNACFLSFAFISQYLVDLG